MPKGGIVLGFSCSGRTLTADLTGERCMCLQWGINSSISSQGSCMHFFFSWDQIHKHFSCFCIIMGKATVRIQRQWNLNAEIFVLTSNNIVISSSLCCSKECYTCTGMTQIHFINGPNITFHLKRDKSFNKTCLSLCSLALIRSSLNLNRIHSGSLIKGSAVKELTLHMRRIFAHGR